MPSYAIDLIIVLAVIFCAWRGATKGLVLSLCGLLASLVAFWGAQTIAGQLTPLVADIIREPIQDMVDEIDLPEIKLPDSILNTDAARLPVGHLLIEKDDILQGLEKADIPGPVKHFVEEFVNGESFEEALGKLQDTPAIELPENPLAAIIEAMVVTISERIAYFLLFSLSFLLIVIVWFLGSHALDLAFRLPILKQINIAGGLLLGAAEAIVVCVVLIAIAQVFGYLPAEPETPIVSMLTIDTLMETLQTGSAAAVASPAPTA